jgi:hypothetical protein
MNIKDVSLDMFQYKMPHSNPFAHEKLLFIRFCSSIVDVDYV